ncbi:hypothetical protein JTB14_001318 [Gonioctena quinquepunctata]|nr:hypothetical protein JTB14_001318 [Gonioctena quinquepunctata]
MFALCLTLLLIIFHTNGDSINSQTDNNINVTYTLWMAPDIEESATINITAPTKTSFYDVMVLAMEKDSYFTFEATHTQFGHYITTIADHTEGVAEGIFWWLYNLEETPDPKNPPSDNFLSPVGVDGLKIDEGHHYLFWYKSMEPNAE